MTAIWKKYHNRMLHIARAWQCFKWCIQLFFLESSPCKLKPHQFSAIRQSVSVYILQSKFSCKTNRYSVVSFLLFLVIQKCYNMIQAMLYFLFIILYFSFGAAFSKKVLYGNNSTLVCLIFTHTSGLKYNEFRLCCFHFYFQLPPSDVMCSEAYTT